MSAFDSLAEYRAAHERALRGKGPCAATIVIVAKKKAELTRDCTECGGKGVRFVFEADVVPNSLK